MPKSDLPALPQNPADWPRLFTERLNAGDLDAVLALYDENARFVSRTGETIVGLDRIREVIRGLIDAKTRLDVKVKKAIVIGDVGVLYSDFQGTTLDPTGATVEMRSRAIEVLHRQPIGGWRLIMGDPDGRG